MKRLFTSFFILFTASGLWAQESYASGSKSFSGRGLTSIPIAISDAGTITDLNVKIKLDHGYDEGLRHTSISLLSPYGTAIILASGDQVGGSWSGTAGGQLYSTVFDDEASTSIYSNNAPFAGSYIPAKPLSSFDKESMTGTWEVLINNKREETGTVEITIMVVTQPPLADFTATPTSGQVPLAVQFTDQSVDIDGTVVSWSWNFGDGNTSTEQNPSHTYETHGVYDVSLSATDNV
ncbi:MAG: PKD domain-containing protein, partial [Candidatus Marinimicrobia bacterium]|nr:PKD domain-containing protein [Candidatus Neomarinimicrobiota bacterium]